jgi:hypothetical protein
VRAGLNAPPNSAWSSTAGSGAPRRVTHSATVIVISASGQRPAPGVGQVRPPQPRVAPCMVLPARPRRGHGLAGQASVKDTQLPDFSWPPFAPVP